MMTKPFIVRVYMAVIIMKKLALTDFVYRIAIISVFEFFSETIWKQGMSHIFLRNDTDI